MDVAIRPEYFDEIEKENTMKVERRFFFHRGRGQTKQYNRVCHVLSEKECGTNCKRGPPDYYMDIYSSNESTSKVHIMWCHFPRAIIYPLVPISINGHNFPAPRYPRKFLVATYGMNFSIPQRQNNHEESCNSDYLKLLIKYKRLLT